MLRLHTFGGCLLTSDGARVDRLSNQRKALGLLAVLAAAGERGVSRDTLLGQLWPESDEEHARTSLKQLVHSLRTRLNHPEVLLGTADLRLNPKVITSDVIEFRAVLTRGDQQSAAALYAGPFLDGFFLRGAGPFERWVETERAALRHDYVSALEALAERACATGNGRAAVESWRRLAAADPLNARAVVGLMRGLEAAGERAAALQHARVYEQLVREELDAEPDHAVAALVERLRLAKPKPANSTGTGGAVSEPVGSEPPRLPAAPAMAAGSARAPERATFVARLRYDVTRHGAAWGGMLAVGTFALVAAGLGISRTWGSSPVASMFAAGARDSSNTLLVADFDIRGGLDPALGGALAEGVRAGLGQSRLVTIVPVSTVRGALERMQRTPGTPLVPAVARELAEREGIKALVEGELTPLRRDFVLTIRLVSTGGSQLASFQQTTDEPGIIRTLDRLTGRLRATMGESLDTVRAALPLDRVTTPSLAALTKFSEGRAANAVTDYARAVARLKEALALDSSFAMAWVALSGTFQNGRYPMELADEAAERAYRHRDRLPDRERYHVEGQYFRRGPGRDRMLAAEAYEAGLRLDSGTFANSLALLYMSRREYARAESLFRWYLRRSNSGFLLGYYNLSAALLFQGKRAEAESLEVEIARRFPDTYDPSHAARLLYDRGELDSAQHALERHTRQANAMRRMAGSFFLSDLHGLRGRLADAERVRREAEEANVLRGVSSDPLGDALQAAFVDIWYRDRPERGLRRVEAALARTPLASLPVLSTSYAHYYLFGEAYYVRVARTYARAGRPDRARAVLAQFGADRRDTSLFRASDPAIRSVLGEVALAEGQPLVALQEFRRADRLPDGPVHRCAICRDADVGRAFDQAGMADSAIATFERYLETPHPDRVGVDAIYVPRILRRLGALHEAKGNREKAIDYYSRFVELWKNADPELQPRVVEARRRLARLQRP
jgi:DNA-binding SARP family transcriptional activator/tetratricopeptide (TPR) repeat protein